MKLKKPCYAASVVLALCLINNASAWPDFQWTGLGNDGLWNNPTNWTNLDLNTIGLPEDYVSEFAVQIDAANGWSVVTIPTGYVVDLDYENPTAYYNTIYGGEFGMKINIYGTLEYGWMMAPVQNDPTPANRGLINMYSGSTLATQGAGIGIGDAWWWYEAAPYVTLNMYGNAQMNVPNVALGGHLNIYDTAVANVSVNVFTGNPLVGGTGNGSTIACSDGTASLVIGGGTLILPYTYTNETAFPGNSIYDLIARGVLRAYGKGYDTNDLIITDDGTNTYVTTVPLGGALTNIYFQPLLRNPMMAGIFEQAMLMGDYPAVKGVLLSSTEPGLDPATFTQPVYTSSNPNVVTVGAQGMVTAVNPGSATLTATVGTKTATLSVTVVPVLCGTNTLVHRYSFSESSGTTAADSVGGSAWNGTLQGTATFSGTGQVVLDGTVGSSVSLPSGILSGLDEVTIEAWATFPSTINAFANLWAFGNTDLIAFDPNYGDGYNYITFSPHTGGLTAQANFGQGVPGSAGERDAVSSGGVLDNQTNVQIVAVFHPLAGYEALYINGAVVATTSMFNNMIDPVAYQGPTFTNGSILAYTLGTDPTNYIGQSLYTGDPGLLANIDEFRIYKGPLTAGQVAADKALGPNQIMGTSTNVSLHATFSGGNMMLSWPTTSALVDLMSSPVLGPGAVWTPVNTSSLVVVGGNYQITIPATGTAFYRLVL